MSLVVFDDGQYRVVIPAIKKLPPNPHISGPGALTRALAPPSETASNVDSESPPEPRLEKAIRHLLLACDQLSFFTGSASADLKAAHVVNAVCQNPDRKKRVEELLTQQRLYTYPSTSFSLDSIHNFILLEANLHTQWDLYGTFCFVPTEHDIQIMCDALRESNTTWNWLAQMPLDTRAARPLDVSKAPFADPQWEIILLHPNGLLPNNQPLAIAENHFLSPNTASLFTWNMWVASGDHLCSLDPPHGQLTPFMFKNERDRHSIPKLSSLAMVINADSKLQQFMRDHNSLASPRVEHFAKLISELVEEIFFVPKPFSAVAASFSNEATLQVPPLGEADDLDTQNPSTAMEQGDNSIPVAENIFHGPVDAPETPDTDGLTDTEFRSLEEKAQDPRLDSKQRSDAAMLMIFGTHRYENPYSAHVVQGWQPITQMPMYEAIPTEG